MTRFSLATALMLAAGALYAQPAPPQFPLYANLLDMPVPVTGASLSQCDGLNVTDHLDFSGYVPGAPAPSDTFEFTLDCVEGTIVDVYIAGNEAAANADHVIGTKLDGVSPLRGALRIAAGELDSGADIFSSDSVTERGTLLSGHISASGVETYTVTAHLQADKSTATAPVAGTLSHAAIFTITAEY